MARLVLPRASSRSTSSSRAVSDSTSRASPPWLRGRISPAESSRRPRRVLIQCTAALSSARCSSSVWRSTARSHTPANSSAKRPATSPSRASTARPLPVASACSSPMVVLPTTSATTTYDVQRRLRARGVGVRAPASATLTTSGSWPRATSYSSSGYSRRITVSPSSLRAASAAAWSAPPAIARGTSRPSTTSDTSTRSNAEPATSSAAARVSSPSLVPCSPSRRTASETRSRASARRTYSSSSSSRSSASRSTSARSAVATSRTGACDISRPPPLRDGGTAWGWGALERAGDATEQRVARERVLTHGAEPVGRARRARSRATRRGRRRLP